MSTCPGICLGGMVFTPTALFYIRACHKCLNLTPSKLTGLSLLSNIGPDNTRQSYKLPTLLYNKGYCVGLRKYLLFFIPSQNLTIPAYLPRLLVNENPYNI